MRTRDSGRRWTTPRSFFRQELPERGCGLFLAGFSHPSGRSWRDGRWAARPALAWRTARATPTRRTARPAPTRRATRPALLGWPARSALLGWPARSAPLGWPARSAPLRRPARSAPLRRPAQSAPPGGPTPATYRRQPLQCDDHLIQLLAFATESSQNSFYVHTRENLRAGTAECQRNSRFWRISCSKLGKDGKRILIHRVLLHAKRLFCLFSWLCAASSAPRQGLFFSHLRGRRGANCGRGSSPQQAHRVPGRPNCAPCA